MQQVLPKYATTSLGEFDLAAGCGERARATAMSDWNVRATVRGADVL